MRKLSGALFGAFVLLCIGPVPPICASAAPMLFASYQLEHQAVADSSSNRWRTLGGEPRDAPLSDTLVVRLMVQHHLSAISVAVVQDDQIVFSAVHGRVRRGRLAGTNTVFRGASLGKPVFAYLVLQLIDEGILDLDSPIDTFLPRPLAGYEH